MRLSKREKMLIVLLTIVAIIALGFQYLIAPQKKRGTELSTQLDSLQMQYIALANKAATLQSVQDKLAASKENSVSTAAPFPDVQTAEELDADLHQWLKQCNLSTQSLTSTALTAAQLTGFTPLPDLLTYPAKESLGLRDELPLIVDISSDTFPCVQFTVAFTGGYLDMLAFLDQVRAQGSGYHVDSLSYAPYTEETYSDEPAPAEAAASTAETPAGAADDKNFKVQGTALISIYMVDKPDFDALFADSTEAPAQPAEQSGVGE